MSLWRQRLSRGDNTPQQDHNPAEAEELPNNSSELSNNSSEKCCATTPQPLPRPNALEQNCPPTRTRWHHSCRGHLLLRTSLAPGKAFKLRPRNTKIPAAKLFSPTRESNTADKNKGRPTTITLKKTERPSNNGTKEEEEGEDSRPTAIDQHQSRITAGAPYAFTRVERR